MKKLLFFALCAAVFGTANAQDTTRPVKANGTTKKFSEPAGLLNANADEIITAINLGTTAIDASRLTLTGVQPLDSDLTAIAALSTTSFGRGAITLADAAAGRTLYGLVIGTNVQAYDADLASIAGLTTTSYGRGFLELANAAAARTAIGLDVLFDGTGGWVNKACQLVSADGLSSRDYTDVESLFDGTGGYVGQAARAEYDSGGSNQLSTLFDGSGGDVSHAASAASLDGGCLVKTYDGSYVRTLSFRINDAPSVVTNLVAGPYRGSDPVEVALPSVSGTLLTTGGDGSSLTNVNAASVNGETWMAMPQTSVNLSGFNNDLDWSSVSVGYASNAGTASGGWPTSLTGFSDDIDYSLVSVGYATASNWAVSADYLNVNVGGSSFAGADLFTASGAAIAAVNDDGGNSLGSLFDGTGGNAKTSVPAPSASDPGEAGQMIFTDTYTYRCFGSGDWRRTPVTYTGGY